METLFNPIICLNKKAKAQSKEEANWKSRCMGAIQT